MTRSCICGLQILVHKGTHQDFNVLLDGGGVASFASVQKVTGKLFFLVPGKGCGPAQTFVAGLG